MSATCTADPITIRRCGQRMVLLARFNHRSLQKLLNTLDTSLILTCVSSAIASTGHLPFYRYDRIDSLAMNPAAHTLKRKLGS